MGSLILKQLRCPGPRFAIETKAQDGQYLVERVFQRATAGSEFRMILKRPERGTSHVSQFDLLGDDEKALSKAFAYVLAKNRQTLFTFLHQIGIRAKNTDNNYLATKVEIEHVRPEGRTDIEILNRKLYHVIVECKVDSGRVYAQRTQYLGCFQDVPHRVMCFITQERDTNKEKHGGITTHHLSWLDILDEFEGARLQTETIARQFMLYATRTHKMQAQKEILVQDLGKSIEVERWKDYSVYKRDVTFGTPLYFAPYFTQHVDANIGTAMEYLSPVLGVLTLRPCEIDEYTADIESFTDSAERVKNWIKGVALGDADYQKAEHTFYFLGEPVRLPHPLLKDGTRKKGSGKNWIAGMIPKNRCVTFAEVVKRLGDSRKS